MLVYTPFLPTIGPVISSRGDKEELVEVRYKTNPPRCDHCHRFGHHTRFFCEGMGAALYHDEASRGERGETVRVVPLWSTRKVRSKKRKRRPRKNRAC